MFSLQPEEDQDLTEEDAALLELIADRLHEVLREFGSDGIEADISEDVFEAIAAVADVMQGQNRTELNEGDDALIRQRVGRLTRKHRPVTAAERRRFATLDRVVCYVGGDRGWAAGTVQALDEDDTSDPTGQRVIPYVVKIDPPNSRLISVPLDANHVVRPEVCFGQCSGALWFTRMCLPKALRRGAQRMRRFGVGDRVSCAVEDATGNYSDWAAGTVVGLDHTVEAESGVAGGIAPYQILLDSGFKVLAHQDEHWLVRDLTLQAAGPRIHPDGTRCLARMEKRDLGEETEMVDHVTRKVRRTAKTSDDEGD